MKIPENEKRFVRETLKELQFALYLTEWNIDIYYMDGPHVDSPNITAETNVNHKYFDIGISIFPKYFERTLEQKRQTLVHELCHIYTQPYKEMWERMSNSVVVSSNEECIINERLTTLIERLASNAYAERLEKITIACPTKKKRRK